jgi:hypothetical protein
MSDDTDEEERDTKAQWKAARDVLKAGVLSGDIHLDTKVMKPKAVFEKYKDSPELKLVTYGDKFTRTLRALRKKHTEGDLENEGLKVIEWGKSAAKQVLKKAFKDGDVPVDYTDPKEVWRDFCREKRAFARLNCDSAFTRRLNSVRDDYKKRASRKTIDQAAFDILKKNHPTPEYNARGEPQWHGSLAQKLMKQDIIDKKHIGRTKEEGDLRSSRDEYKVGTTGLAVGIPGGLSVGLPAGVGIFGKRSRVSSKVD